jgi:hypothetical protein
VIEALIVLLVLGSDLFRWYQLVLSREGAVAPEDA